MSDHYFPCRREVIINFFRSAVHLFFKSLSFFFFGLGGLFFALFVGPAALLAVSRDGKSNDAFRSLVSHTFRFFSNFMVAVGLIRLEVEGRENLSQARSMIICANHPTLLDAVFLIALTPQADCIVKASLWRNPFTMPVVSRLYIPNLLDGEAVISQSGESLAKGHNLILFPEGTRTDYKKNDIKLHRSAAQIALRNNRDILPVHIEINSPRGLGKGDSFFSIPDNYRFEYKLEFGDPIAVSSFLGLPLPLAARRLTEEIKAVINH